MTSKVDSLVKFLEEERASRKKAEADLDKRDRKITNLECQVVSLQESNEKATLDLKSMQENLLKYKDENDRLRREKVESMDEKQKFQFKVLDLESKLRATSKYLSDKERELERCTKEKYEA